MHPNSHSSSIKVLPDTPMRISGPAVSNQPPRRRLSRWRAWEFDLYIASDGNPTEIRRSILFVVRQQSQNYYYSNQSYPILSVHPKRQPRRRLSRILATLDRLEFDAPLKRFGVLFPVELRVSVETNARLSSP